MILTSLMLLPPKLENHRTCLSKNNREFTRHFPSGKPLRQFTKSELIPHIQFHGTGIAGDSGWKITRISGDPVENDMLVSGNTITDEKEFARDDRRLGIDPLQKLFDLRACR